MPETQFTGGDFFRLAQQVAAQESALRIAEADAAAERRIRLAAAGIAGDAEGPAQPSQSSHY